MTDRPILFSGPMVRALLDGRKTQTRRILKPKKNGCLISSGFTDDYILDPGNREWLESYYRWRIGDRLWVKESHRVAAWDEDGAVWMTYDADGARSRALEPSDEDFIERLCSKLDKAGVPTKENGFYGDIPDNLLRRVSIHMPRWASRLTLTVTDVRVERLQAISAEDAKAEGIEWIEQFGNGPTYRDYQLSERHVCEWYSDPIKSYRSLWDTINGAGAWDANPWVVAVSFRVAHHNVGAPRQIEHIAASASLVAP